MNIKWHPRENLPFKLGQKVWVIDRRENGPPRVVECTISSYQAKVISAGEESEEAVAIVTGYETQPYTFMALAGNPLRERDIYHNEEEAEEDARWITLYFTSDAWRRALGVDSTGERVESELETCELGRCCADISAARDLLVQAMLAEGITWRDAQVIEEILKNHDDISDAPTLAMIREAFLS